MSAAETGSDMARTARLLERRLNIGENQAWRFAGAIGPDGCTYIMAADRADFERHASRTLDSKPDGKGRNHLLSVTGASGPHPKWTVVASYPDGAIQDFTNPEAARRAYQAL